MRKLSVNQIRSCDSGLELANYCNRLEVDEIALGKALGNFGVSLSNLVRAQYDGVEVFDSKYECVKKNGEASYSFKFRFSVGGVENADCFVIVQDGYDKFLSDMSREVALMIEGAKAVNKLNEFIQSIQAINGSSVQIIYRWGMDSKFCMISSWDFDKINVRLSCPSITQLIELNNNNELEKLVAESDWAFTIVKFITNFNSIPFHKRIDAVDEITSFEGMLFQNMLETKQIPLMVRYSRANTGTQEVRTVSIIKELGKFLVLVDWRIDYSRKSISMHIVNDKVLDIEDDRFISDREIVDRIEKRVNIPENTRNKLFEGVGV